MPEDTVTISVLFDTARRGLENQQLL